MASQYIGEHDESMDALVKDELVLSGAAAATTTIHELFSDNEPATSKMQASSTNE